MILENTFYITLVIDIDIKFTLGVLNFMPNLKGLNKEKKQLIIIWMLIVRKVIYNIFYRNEIFNEEEIWTACMENITLIRIFRKENKLFMNQRMDFRQLWMLDYMCDTLKKVIDISPKLWTIIRKYRRDEYRLKANSGTLNNGHIVRYKLCLYSGINEPSNDFLLKQNFQYFEKDIINGAVDSETRIDLDNDRRRHGINNQEKIELLYNADI